MSRAARIALSVAGLVALAVVARATGTPPWLGALIGYVYGSLAVMWVLSA